MHHETYRITVDDGASLQVYQWLPDGRPRGTIQLIHGISERASRYQQLAAALTGAGYAVYAHDQRGHGLTATAADLGYVCPENGWQRLLGDLLAVYCHIAERQPDLRRVLLGHSMGSLLAQHFAITHGGLLDGLILSATTYRTDPLPKLGCWLAQLIGRLCGPRYKSPLLDFLTVGALRLTIRNRRTPADWLSRDPAVVDAYIADPLCGGIPAVTLWRDVYEGVGFIADPQQQAKIPRALPILLLTGGADPLSSGGRQVQRLAERYRALGINDVSCRIYPGARHEVFNEIIRDEVYADLLDWLDARLASPPLGTLPAIAS
jgi:alpha-beta hydrolase superfamily lysophospholipase